MRDDFSQKVVATLARRAGQHCSNPACGKGTSGPQPSSSSRVATIGTAAHITGASPGGKRYDASLTNEQRASIENGIWLCEACGKLIDTDEKTYSVPVLNGWKKNRERLALEAMGGNQQDAIVTFERRLAGHTNFVWDITITPDGRRVVSASNDKSIRVWDAATGAPISVLEGSSAFVCSVAVSPDGLLIASGALDGHIMVWEVQSGSVRKELDLGVSDAKVCWRPDGRVLVAGGADGSLAFWQTDDWSLQGRCATHDGPILKVTCMRDNHRVISVSADKTIRVSEMDPFHCRQVFRGHAEDVNSIAVTPDERLLISASGDKTLRVWDVAGGTCHKTLYGHDDVVWRVAVSPDGKILASGSGDNTVCLWSLDDGAMLQRLEHPDCIAAVAFSPKGDRLVVGCDDTHVYIYRVNN